MEHKRTTNPSTFIHPKGVFCLENEWFGLSSTVSVLPALRLLHDSDYKVPFIHRDVATRAELEHYLRKWLMEKHANYDILWLAMHTRKGLLLPGDVRRHDEKMDLDQLEYALAGKCAGRMIHFGGCRTLLLPKERITRFLRVTRAVSVSGFLTEVDWTESTLFETTLLLEMQKHPGTRKGLLAVRNAMRRLRPLECRKSGFVMHLRAPAR
jgi:hypothetical protein